jgi:hypothetical protein
MYRECVTITAVKYRFINHDRKGLRYCSRQGSVPALFGLWEVFPKHDTPLLVEGEISALSVWQCLPSGVSCLSIGSESGGRVETIRPLAQCYKRILIWADAGERAAQIRSSLAHQAPVLRSRVRDAVKGDADKMLQEGILKDFLSQVLNVPCLG